MPGEACLMGKKSVKRKVIFSYNNNGCSSQTIQRRYCFDVFLLLSKSPLLERFCFSYVHLAVFFFLEALFLFKMVFYCIFGYRLCL